MRFSIRRYASARGQATVEFALVLPILLLLIGGGIQFGLAFNYWLDLNHIASEGARWASVNRLPATTTLPSGSNAVTPAQVQAYVQSQVLSQGLLERHRRRERGAGGHGRPRPAGHSD